MRVSIKNKTRWGFLVMFFISPFCLSAQQETNTRIALCIGVQHYKHVSPLKNSLKDARDMASVLKQKGFHVIELYDPKSKREIQETVRKYFDFLNGNSGSTGLLFYSGHGMQVDGSNYLIPTDANPQLKADLDEECLRMEYILRALEEAGNSLNIIIMDACRNNPFRSFTRASGNGLTIVDAPKGSYIVYATKPGSVASDGVGSNGLFTSKLLKYMNEGDLNIEQVFKKVARDVSDESNEAQRPWISSDYTGDFYFTRSEIPGNQKPTEIPTATFAQPEQEERGIHVSTEDTFKSALNAYQQGEYSTAIHVFHRLSENSHTQSYYYLGLMYFDGDGTPRDFGVALRWFLKGADANHKESQYKTGTMYLKGQGVEKNEIEAIAWLKKAALNDHVKAQFTLGEIYFLGTETINKDKTEAIKWFKKAAEQSDTSAQQALQALGVK